MPNENQVTLCGHLTRDPELRFSPSGMAICKFGLAVNQRTGRGDTAKDVAHFFDVTCFRDTAEEVGEQLRKGAAALVIGTLQLEQWDDKATGQKRSKVSIIANIVALPLYQKREGKQEAPRPAPAASEKPPESDDVPF